MEGRARVNVASFEEEYCEGLAEKRKIEANKEVAVEKKGLAKIRKRRAIFEMEQQAKGLVKLVDRSGNELWGTPEQVFEWQQKAKGLVKYGEEWVTPQEFERRQTEKGLVKFTDRLGRERWVTPKQAEEWTIVDMDMRNNFAGLKPRQFEELVGNLLKEMGYDVALTSRTADYGADIIAKKGEDTVVVEVKKYALTNKVSNRDIQRLLGSMWKYKANKAIFVTSSVFTDFAYKQARGAPIELWNHSILCEKIEKHLLKF